MLLSRPQETLSRSKTRPLEDSDQVVGWLRHSSPSHSPDPVIRLPSLVQMIHMRVPTILMKLKVVVEVRLLMDEMYRPGQHVDVLHIENKKSKAKPAQKPPSAVIYTRVSYSRQLEGTSLEVQEKACKAFCEAKNLKVLKVFVEEGASAYKGKYRTVFEEMIRFCRDHQDQLSAVVVYDVTRFFRDAELHMQYRKLLLTFGIELLTPQVELGPDPFQMYVERSLANQATLHSDLKSKTSKSTQITTRRKGRLTQRAPIGYLNQRQLEGQRRTLVVHDPARAPIIAEAFKMYAYSDRSKLSIYRWATEAGLTNRKSGKPISTSTFDRILENPVYAGIIHVVDNEYVIAEFEPIITKDLFEEVQAKLMGDPSRRVSHSKEPTGRPLQGVLLCPDCGVKLSGSHRPGKSGKLYGYYHYSRHKKDCTMKSLHVPVGKAEAGFLEVLARITTEKTVLTLLEEMISEKQESNRKMIAKELESIKEVREEQEKIKEGLLNLFALGDIDKTEYKAGTERVGQAMDKLALREMSAQASVVPMDYLLKRALMALEHLDIMWKTASESDKMRIAKTLFPDGFTCDKEGHVGTPPDAHQFGLLTLLDTSESEVATPTGIEPVLPA